MLYRLRISYIQTNNIHLLIYLFYFSYTVHTIVKYIQNMEVDGTFVCGNMKKNVIVNRLNHVLIGC